MPERRAWAPRQGRATVGSDTSRRALFADVIAFDGSVANVCQRSTSAHRHGAVQFVGQDINHRLHTGLPATCQAIEHRPSQQDGIRARMEQLEDIAAPLHPAEDDTWQGIVMHLARHMGQTGSRSAL